MPPLAADRRAPSTSDGPASAAERAYNAIRLRILEGELAEGQMLSESRLAEEVGVSRTPVRSALSRLQEDGWIVIYPKRGALVRGLSDRAIAELAEARLMLEASSVAQATDERRRSVADALSAGIDEQEAALARGDVRAFIEHTIVFHRSFVEVSGNETVLALSDRLGDRQRYLLHAHGDRLLARRAEIIAEHRALVEHMARGDDAAFAAALRAHIGDTHGAEVRAV